MHARAIAATAFLVLSGTALAAGPTNPDPRRTPIVETIERAKWSVVNISALRMAEKPALRSGPRGDLFDDFFRRYFAMPSQAAPGRSLGTGFVVDAKGLVLTNHHVVAQTETIQVKLASGDTFDAELIGAAPDVDLALLQIKGAEGQLPAALEFFVDTPYVGETVIAIGNPFGLDHSVTVGVVSALDRSFSAQDRVYAGVLQTDTSINPGNSGGPLLNVLGQVVGVNTAIYQDAQGIGFAIPGDVASRVLAELRSSGRLPQSWLGVEAQDLNRTLAASLALRSTDGVLVSAVVAASPAARAGVAVGDLITGVGGHRIRNLSDFGAYLDTFPPGRQVGLDVRRDGRALTLNPTVIAYDPRRINNWFERIGVRTRDSGGMYVITEVRRGTIAEEIGFQVGDAIAAIDRVPVSDATRLQQYLLGQRHKSNFLLLVQRGRYAQRVGLRLPEPDATY